MGEDIQDEHQIFTIGKICSAHEIDFFVENYNAIFSL